MEDNNIVNKKSVWPTIVAILLIALVAWSFLGNKKEVSGEPITIGAILPMTGTLASQAEFARNGIELAREKLADEGIVLDVIYEDSQLDPKVGISAFNKLVQTNKVKSVLSFTSPVSMAIAPLANQQKIVTISLLTSPSYSTPNDYTYRMVGSAVLEARGLSENVKAGGYKRIGVLYINNEYGLGISDTLKGLYPQANSEIVSAEAFLPTDTDYRSPLAKIKNTNPDVVILAAFGREVALAVRQAREIGITVPFLCSAPCESPDTLEIAGDLAEGLLAVSPTNKSEESIRVLYVDKYGIEPNYVALRMYDSTMILAHVHNKCGQDATSECLLSEMENIENFTGASYQINFDENGDINDQYVNKVVKDGKFVRVE